MEATNLVFGVEARQKMLAGVEKIEKAVVPTIGPRGRTVMIENKHGNPHITKDGVSCARVCNPKDPTEAMAAAIMRQSAERTVEACGDGTSATIALGAEMYREAVKLLASGVDPQALKRGMEKTSEALMAEIDKLSKPVKDAQDIKNVATVSANGDKAVGDLISAAIDAVGRDGHIVLADGDGHTETKLISETGFATDRGYLHPAFINNPEKQTVVYENPAIWVINGKLDSPNHMNEIMPVLEAFHNSGQPLVMFVEDMSSEPLMTVALNAARRTIKVAVSKLAGYGDRRKECAQDICVLTGATLRDTDTGEKLVLDTSAEELGKAKRVVMTKEKTVLVAADGRELEIENHVKKIKSQVNQESSKWDKDRTEQRLARLVGGIATIQVGDPNLNPIALKEKKDRIEDALGAVKASLQGIIPGGGAALLKARTALTDAKFTTGSLEEDFGRNIVLKACGAPFKQILQNSGEVSETAGAIMAQISNPKEPTLGYDAQKHEVCDMFGAGIIDPTLVCKTALSNAVATAGLLATTETAISFEQAEDKHQHPGAGMMM